MIYIMGPNSQCGMMYYVKIAEDVFFIHAMNMLNKSLPSKEDADFFFTTSLGRYTK